MTYSWTRFFQSAKKIPNQMQKNIQKTVTEYISFFKDVEEQVDENLVNVEKQLGYFHEKETGSHYYGNIYQGKMHGKGIFIEENKSIYLGDFYLNQKHGLGIAAFENGCFYFGQFSFGYPTGVGVFENENIIHCGNFLSSISNGIGVRYIKNEKIIFSNFFSDFNVEATKTFSLKKSSSFQNLYQLNAGYEIPVSVFPLQISSKIISDLQQIEKNKEAIKQSIGQEVGTFRKLRRFEASQQQKRFLRRIHPKASFYIQKSSEEYLFIPEDVLLHVASFVLEKRAWEKETIFTLLDSRLDSCMHALPKEQIDKMLHSEDF